MITKIIMLLLAAYAVFFLHELGHVPKRIYLARGFIPQFAAIDAKSRYGGLLVNVIIFLGVFMLMPTQIFLQLMGFIAWVHFILYAFLGSFNKEPTRVKRSTILDDIPNSQAVFWVLVGIVTFIFLKDYYLSIITGFF